MTREFDLGGIRPWGRRLSEYQAFFALEDLKSIGPILDVGAGPSSFAAEATALGASVVAVDPIYARGADAIRAGFAATARAMRTGLGRASYRFVWSFYESPEELYRLRREALALFLADFDAGTRDGRYVADGLPTLGFPDRSFRLALCSHLLFLYADDLELDFHIRSLTEMLRVAEEVRVFPLVALDGGPSRHLAPVRAALSDAGARADLVTVPFELQKGATQMLRIVKC